MKKAKVYRPRRSMRMTNGQKGVSPAASFISGPAVSRTRPTKPKVSRTPYQLDSVTVSGSVQSSVAGQQGAYRDPSQITILTSSIYIEGALSTGRSYERKKLNATLLGQSRTSIGRAPWPSTTVIDVNPTGSFTSPSWTHASIGMNHAFVMTALTSSDHEVTTLGMFRSGTQPIENSSVPASATLYYSKNPITYNTVIAKHTASFFDTVVRIGATVPATFLALSGCLLNNVTGSSGGVGFTTNNNIIQPASIFIDVPVSGKLVNISIWVELHHQSGALTVMPLASLGIAIKSPNVRNFHGNPLSLGVPGTNDYFYGNAPNTFGWDVNSFILWEGFGVSNGNNNVWVSDGNFTPNSVAREKFAGWDRDLGMRTVFTDNAVTSNPRHNVNVSPSGNYTGSPNAALLINNAWGMATSWTGSAGSPPSGWLTGPGGIASVNEWATTGVNNGTNSLKPLYPLLDPITVRPVAPHQGETYPTSLDNFPIDFKSSIGSRPGLRGSEISGTWELVFVNSLDDAPDSVMSLWFRQARLEITYENVHVVPRQTRTSTKLQAFRAGERFLYQLSGTWGTTSSLSINSVVPKDAEIGRTFGVTLSTGSFRNDYALLYRLSGALATISGSSPGWLLNNAFGMPQIPENSSSLASYEPYAAQPVVTSHDSFVNRVRTLDGARRLADVANDINPQRTLVQLASAFVSASAI